MVVRVGGSLIRPHDAPSRDHAATAAQPTRTPVSAPAQAGPRPHSGRPDAPARTIAPRTEMANLETARFGAVDAGWRLSRSLRTQPRARCAAGALRPVSSRPGSYSERPWHLSLSFTVAALPVAGDDPTLRFADPTVFIAVHCVTSSRRSSRAVERHIGNTEAAYHAPATGRNSPCRLVDSLGSGPLFFRPASTTRCRCWAGPARPPAHRSGSRSSGASWLLRGRLIVERDRHAPLKVKGFRTEVTQLAGSVRRCLQWNVVTGAPVAHGSGLQVTCHGTALRSRTSGVVRHHAAGLPVAGQHDIRG